MSMRINVASSISGRWNAKTHRDSLVADSKHLRIFDQLRLRRLHRRYLSVADSKHLRIFDQAKIATGAEFRYRSQTPSICASSISREADARPRRSRRRVADSKHPRIFDQDIVAPHYA